MSALVKPISSFLSASPHARLLGRLDLGFGRAAAIWCNRDDRITYDTPDGHTFSCYLHGGTGTRRVDGTPSTGWPGAVCIMPHGQSSQWDIRTPFSFVHLYMPDDELRRAFSETCDRDARLLDIPDLTYADAPELSAPFHELASAVRNGNPLRAEGAMSELVGAVFASPRYCGRQHAGLTGGLAPRKLRMVLEFIDANLDRTVRLRDLGQLVQLSEFHLQRAFRASCGVSPHVWITHCRVERAKAMIRDGEPLSQVAAACGFSTQSHLTHVFKAATGQTPAAYHGGAPDRR